MEFSQNAFAAPTRTLTSLGAGAMSTFSSQNQSLAANATVSLAPAASRLRFANVGIKAGAAGSAVLQINDGTNIFIIATVATGTSAGFGSTASEFTTPLQIKNNDAANAAIWAAAGGDFIT